MSIFKSTFTEDVKKQLNVRQDAMISRTPQALQYLNSRNAWVRMVSSVDVNNDKGALARKYVLQGGTLNDTSKIGTAFTGSLKSGVGAGFSNAYSNFSQNGTRYRLGIRPMPGITSVEIKSLSAYGSLREATVNFQCWDIQQLEDLEVLYMRPGYTLLLEWGWTPYLDNKGKYQPNFTDYYDILNKENVERTTLFRELFQKSVKYGGNYDAMFGYVKNYQWSARMDGGYDCQTNIITTGEIIESLKINYNTALPIAAPSQSNVVVPLAPPPPPQIGLVASAEAANFVAPQQKGLLIKEFPKPGSTENWIGFYQKNILAGMWAELYYKSTDPSSAISLSSAIEKGGIINYLFPSLSPSPDATIPSLSTNNYQTYITLGTMCNLLNDYIIAKGSKDKKPLVRLSLKSNEYDGSPVTDLYCTAHPLQVSVDPSVCLIKSPLWYEQGGPIDVSDQSVEANTEVDRVKSIAQKIKDGWDTAEGTDEITLEEGILAIDSVDTYNAVEALIKDEKQNYGKENYRSIQQIINEELGNEDYRLLVRIENHLKRIGIELKYTPFFDNRLKRVTNFIEDTITITVPPASSTTVLSQLTIRQKAKKALANIQKLKELPNDYFYGGDPASEIGVIKNIYVNVNYLFQQALGSNLQAGDSKGKNEISLLSYLKKIVSDIQSAIGNVSNFEIHVDPVDNNVARIIDVNYTEVTKATYENLFELQVHNLQSVVRSYTLQSQIFPDQGATIAIGSQARGGQLGMQTNTFIDFNRSLIDRIIPEKLDGILSPPGTLNNKVPTIVNGMAQIILAFSSLSDVPKVDSSESKTDFSILASDAKNALRDIIVYFQSLLKSPGSNRNLIPTKFSCEMDGIGGLVIGHMFRLSEDIMPKGYKGEGNIGSKLGNAVTSISHTISNGDWSTQIDSLNIVLDDTKSEWGLIDIAGWKALIESTFAEQITPLNLGGNAPISANVLEKFGQVDKSVPIHGRVLLDMISYTEGTAKVGQNGYDIMFSNKAIAGWTADTTQKHPNICWPFGKKCSTAAGRYQFLYDTWIGTVGNIAFSQKNQDLAGWKKVLGRTTEATTQEAYNIASSGVKDVSKNEAFLKMLGIGKTNFAGEWASIPDRNGRYQYPPQGGKEGPQDIYNIYLEAINRNGVSIPLAPSQNLPPTGAGNINATPNVTKGNVFAPKF